MEQNLLEKKVNKLEGIIRQLVYLLQASPAIPQHASENLLKMMDAKEVEDEVRDTPDSEKGGKR